MQERPTRGDEGRWWMPIVVGLVVLLLLGVFGFGLWLIASASEDGEPGPVNPPVPSTTPQRPSPTASKPPATEQPRVVVPDLVGVTLEEAEARLDRLGLTYRVRYQPDESEPGTVLATAPDAGSRVAPGSRVRLTVASEPEVTESPVPSTTGPG